MLLTTFKRKYFDKHSTLTFGEKGSGKDLLMSNIAVRNKFGYYSNIPYGGKKGELFTPQELNIPITFKQLSDGAAKPFSFRFGENKDFYISDAGVYFPSQFCSNLNTMYQGVPLFMSLSRHLTNSRVHCNAQTCNRLWDKIREQAEIYIRCKWSFVIFGFAIQRVLVYEKYDSAVAKVPPCPYRAGLTKSNENLQIVGYQATYGKIDKHLLIYRHKSHYDTRYFKCLIKKGDYYEKGFQRWY